MTKKEKEILAPLFEAIDEAQKKVKDHEASLNKELL